MRKLLILSFGQLLIFVGMVHAQTFEHAVGATISVVGSKGEVTYNVPMTGPYKKKYNFIMEKYELTYFPRVNFELGTNSSFSAGLPLSFGGGMAKDVVYDKAGFYFSYDIPILADINFGLGATEESERSFGYFLGGGFGYNHIGFSLIEGLDKINSYGPIAHGGFRIKSGNGPGWFGKGVTFGLTYKYGLESYHYKTGGIQILIDL